MILSKVSLSAHGEAGDGDEAQKLWQGIYLTGFFTACGSGQTGKNSRKLVRVGSAQASQDFFGR